MSETRSEVRPGAYFDSVLLMQLQRELAQLPGVIDAGVVMATPANCKLLESSGFSFEDDAKSDDLLIVVEAEDEKKALDAIAQVDSLMARRRESRSQDYLPKSLDSAAKQLPQASWVLISVPGRYATKVARDALDINKHVFLYSDNVSLDDEVVLKQLASAKGLLLMGPDCGTAIIDGVGFGFANRVRKGSIGLVAASGTGLQVIASEIHRRGGGISQAIGTGGRDLDQDVGGVTALEGLKLLQNDDETRVIILVSKPPEQKVAARLLVAAYSCGKPVVVDFIGFAPPARQIGKLKFAASLADAASQAVRLVKQDPELDAGPTLVEDMPGSQTRFVRGLFAGGTIAYEVLHGLQSFLSPVYSNMHPDNSKQHPDLWHSQAHTVMDLGDDMFTQGRLHPMLDNDYRLRRLRQEGADKEVGVIILDLVLGEGAHPDPASELAPAVSELLDEARQNERLVDVVAIVIGTDEDPQDLDGQIEQMRHAGAVIFQDIGEALAFVLRKTIQEDSTKTERAASSAFQTPLAAINVGLDVFFESMQAQGADVVNVDWRPPAGGNERLAALLSKMK